MFHHIAHPTHNKPSHMRDGLLCVGCNRQIPCQMYLPRNRVGGASEADGTLHGTCVLHNIFRLSLQITDVGNILRLCATAAIGGRFFYGGYHLFVVEIFVLKQVNIGDFLFGIS